ncbi:MULTISPECIES: hypothetical protein [unclassified Pseudovibrio]|uniref:hypothetical protein n=1 Tax=unclassified Pseudovibrio TaxID=2627060 RepID=UPI0007AE9397|nr:MULTISPECIES: hypothetical protein [unclassified Pseudovibrio]KZK99986.1 hypothetical protein PsW74_02602 [Pseudovibrio sp. W74]KZL11816.1 hypothetical protein PsAD14_00732 [Pseudovibrio sp. Ad14]
MAGKTLKTFKNLSDFRSGFSDLKQKMDHKHGIHLLDITKFDKELGNKTFLEKSYEAAVEDSPKVSKISEAHGKLTRLKNSLERESSGFEDLDKLYNKLVTQLNEASKKNKGDVKKLSEDKEYDEAQANLLKLAPHWKKASKKRNDFRKAERELAALDKKLTEIKAEASKKCPVEVKRDSKKLLLLIAGDKVVEYSLKHTK